MKKFFFLVITLPLFLLISCENASRETINYGPKTQELIALLEDNPDIKTLLIQSIEQAKKENPDPKTNPAQTLDEYYAFVNWCEQAMPWQLLEVDYATTLYDKIDQSLCYFFYINDQPLKQLESKGYFNNSVQYMEPYREWLTSFNQSWGEFMDQETSWNEEYYQMALSDDIFGLKNGWYEDPSNWNTFNQFFSRQLKSPIERPISDINNHRIVVSPADATPQGTWAIDADSKIIEKEGVPIKSITLYDIQQLIGEESAYATAFANGTFTHSFLDVGDYHRYHFPVSGVIKEVRIIPGVSISGGYTTWDAENNRYKFDPSSVGWQTLETRGCVIVETEDFGLVGLLPIGMWPVSSVNFESTVEVGKKVNKGDMLGYFLFGGSDFIILFQDQVDFKLHGSDNPENSFEHLLMGEQLGILTSKYE